MKVAIPEFLKTWTEYRNWYVCIQCGLFNDSILFGSCPYGPCKSCGASQFYFKRIVGRASLFLGLGYYIDLMLRSNDEPLYGESAEALKAIEHFKSINVIKEPQ